MVWNKRSILYYGVPSHIVEAITGFDEGFKPNWLDEFKKRNITVYGNIEPQTGEEVLREYVARGLKVYKPEK